MNGHLELSPRDVIDDNIFISKKDEWRTNVKWRDKVYYYEYRTRDECFIKLYFQRRKVDYADYKIGFYYVDKEDVKWK